MNSILLPRQMWTLVLFVLVPVAAEYEWLNRSYLDGITNAQSGASLVSGSKYPWLARVAHSRSGELPFVCTASCISEGIFITAANHIYTLKIKYTTVWYLNQKFEALAIVLPTPKNTRQGFDDIGFIVVKTKSHKNIKWAVIKPFSGKRTGQRFEWFDKINGKYKAIGYAFNTIRPQKTDKPSLYELDVLAGARFCSEMITNSKTSGDYLLPCYYACKELKCDKKLRSESAAVIDSKTTLMGVASCQLPIMGAGGPSPVGFAVPNSDNFFEDFDCAKKIYAHGLKSDSEGPFQSLCKSG